MMESLRPGGGCGCSGGDGSDGGEHGDKRLVALVL